MLLCILNIEISIILDLKIHHPKPSSLSICLILIFFTIQFLHELTLLAPRNYLLECNQHGSFFIKSFKTYESIITRETLLATESQSLTDRRSMNKN